MKTAIALPLEASAKIGQALEQLCHLTGAECVLLADISGHLIDVYSQMRDVDPAAVAALAAGDVAAAAELARQIGEPHPCAAVFHEGQHRSIYLVNVAGNLILAVIFQTTTPVGLVRLMAGRVAERLQTLIAQYEESPQPHEVFSTADLAALMSQLEQTFGD